MHVHAVKLGYGHAVALRAGQHRATSCTTSELRMHVAWVAERQSVCEHGYESFHGIVPCWRGLRQV